MSKTMCWGLGGRILTGALLVTCTAKTSGKNSYHKVLFCDGATTQQQVNQVNWLKGTMKAILMKERIWNGA